MKSYPIRVSNLPKTIWLIEDTDMTSPEKDVWAHVFYTRASARDFLKRFKPPMFKGPCRYTQNG